MSLLSQASFSTISLEGQNRSPRNLQVWAHVEETRKEKQRMRHV